jgi:hypothetical protein
MRINARLDEEGQAQLEYLTLATGQGVSHVVRESVARYYLQVKQQQPRPSRLLAMVGAGHSGRTDISSNVKNHLTEILERKLGLPPSEASQGLRIQPNEQTPIHKSAKRKPSVAAGPATRVSQTAAGRRKK